MIEYLFFFGIHLAYWRHKVFILIIRKVGDVQVEVMFYNAHTLYSLWNSQPIENLADESLNCI